MSSPRRCTYRLQLRPGFGYREAAALAPYLAELGVSHVYTSPYLQAAPGSTHGYDVVDPSRINAELGSDADHAAMRAAFRTAGLAQLIDIVPNHMAVGHAGNRWWWDVLENGQASRYASYFDVDWDPAEERLRDQILVPVLGDHYGRILEGRELRIDRTGGNFLIRYHDRAFPVSPRTADSILAAAGLEDLAGWAAALPPSSERDEASVKERSEGKERLAAELARRAEDPQVRARLDAELARLNADVEALDLLLARQNYRLAYWRVAAQELVYRRFFDIAELAALRLEREHVFEDTHALILRWARDGDIDGLRVDHPDGLRDPEEYFERLAAAAPGRWVLAEKILQRGERIGRTWPVAGTTGYEFLALASGLFVDPAAETLFTDLHTEMTGDARPYADVLYASKHDVMRGSLAADLERLVQLFVHICESRRRFRDHTRAYLRETLRETVACFPVYRSYVRAERGILHPDDERWIAQATAEASVRRPDLDPELFDLLRDILTLRITGHEETALTMRFQQYTAPVTAKGAEDTAFYRYVRLAALNEVGGDPGRFGTTGPEFHAHNARIAAEWPDTLLASSTHDTKRSEDVRLRIALLTQCPGEWAATVRRWRERNGRHRGPLVDGSAEYLFYQTVVGAHPLGVDRALDYVQKAAREAKTRTSWFRQDQAYEDALAEFVRAVLADPEFARDLDRFADALVAPGRIASLALTLLKLTSPGVPDIYQGTELWDLSLVDPDNRRPVDLRARRALLAQLPACDARTVLARADTGLPKLFLIHRALALRARRPEPFAGGYTPLAATGTRADAVAAFARGDAVVTAVPLRPLAAAPWGDTAVRLPHGAWLDVLSGATHQGATTAERLFSGFPVALLERA